MESCLQCGGAASDVDDRMVYASVSLDGCSLSHRWLAAGLDMPECYSPALQHSQTTADASCRLSPVYEGVQRYSKVRHCWRHGTTGVPVSLRWERVWKASRCRRSSCGNVQHSEPYRRMDRMQTRNRRNLVSVESLWCLQTLCIELMAEEAMPIRLITSSVHQKHWCHWHIAWYSILLSQGCCSLWNSYRDKRMSNNNE